MGIKLRIDNELMIEGFFADARLLGIVAPMEQYRFCWHLNKLLNFNFRINHNLEIQLNKNEGEFLLPEFKHLDFLWLAKDELMPDNEMNSLISSIKTIPVVQLVTELTNEKIRHK